MPLEILTTPPLNAEENMRLAKTLLEGLANSSSSFLHFYEWQRPSFTYGYFTKPEEFLNKTAANEEKLDKARRPTGGGIIFHTFDLAFSLLLSSSHPKFSTNTLKNYAFVNQAISLAVQECFKMDTYLLPSEAHPLDESCSHFCLAKPTVGDVMCLRGKVAGGAQRRTRYGLLHQGSITLALPSLTFLEKILIPDTKVIEAFHLNSASLLSSQHSQKDFDEAKQTLKKVLIRVMRESI